MPMPHCDVAKKLYKTAFCGNFRLDGDFFVLLLNIACRVMRQKANARTVELSSRYSFLSALIRTVFRLVEVFAI